MANFMTTNRTLAGVRSDALSLSEPERAELARDLVASLDGTADPNAAEAWNAEILRRLAEIEAGTATMVDREELRQRMLARLSRT
jgi:putative addiction module component (TIGR02574 family)